MSEEPRALSRVIVKLTGTDLEARAAELAGRLPGGTVVRVSGSGRAVIAIEPGADTAAAAASLSAEPDVVYAEPDTEDRAV
jgi:hypothetical protein